MKFRIKNVKDGDIVEVEPSNWSSRKGTITEVYAISLPDFLEEVKEPEYRYCDTGKVIKKNDRFQYLTGNGMIFGADWNMAFDPEDEEEMINTGNVFETEAGAEKHLAFLKARATLKRFMMEKNGSLGREDSFYEIYYDDGEKNFCVNSYSTVYSGEVTSTTEKAQ